MSKLGDETKKRVFESDLIWLLIGARGTETSRAGVLVYLSQGHSLIFQVLGYFIEQI